MGNLRHFQHRFAAADTGAGIYPAKNGGAVRPTALDVARGLLGPIYVLALTLATPHIGVGLTMVGILFGQVAASLVIDHQGWLGAPRRAVDRYRLAALVAILVALWLTH